MKFLVDNALSPVLATLPSRAGHDALHVRTIELQRAEDIVIFDRAAAEDRILVSADTDFGALLAARQVKKPSVIQFRGPGSRKPDALARAILSNLSQLADALERGSIVTFEPSRVRGTPQTGHRTIGVPSAWEFIRKGVWRAGTPAREESPG